MSAVTTVGLIDLDAVGGIDCDGVALDRRDLKGLTGQIAGHRLARHHVIGEDRRELVPCSPASTGPSIVPAGSLANASSVGGENGEGAFTLKGVNQLGSLKGCDEGFRTGRLRRQCRRCRQPERWQQ